MYHPCQCPVITGSDKSKAIPILLENTHTLFCPSKVLKTSVQPYLAYLQPGLVQRQEQNLLLQLLQGDLFVVPAGSDLGLKDAG